jgi:hypothetical protein
MNLWVLRFKKQQICMKFVNNYRELLWVDILLYFVLTYYFYMFYVNYFYFCLYNIGRFNI